MDEIKAEHISTKAQTNVLFNLLPNRNVVNFVVNFWTVFSNSVNYEWICFDKCIPRVYDSFDEIDLVYFRY